LIRSSSANGACSDPHAGVFAFLANLRSLHRGISASPDTTVLLAYSKGQRNSWLIGIGKEKEAAAWRSLELRLLECHAVSWILPRSEISLARIPLQSYFSALSIGAFLALCLPHTTDHA
jgi:hypothetical protein